MLNTLDESDGVPIQYCVIHCKAFDLLPSNPKLSLVEKRLTVESNSSFLTGDNELPAELVMRKTLAPLKDLYDYILIDCPPSAGLLTINALSASDSVLIPLEAHFLGFEAVKQTLDLILPQRSQRIKPQSANMTRSFTLLQMPKTLSLSRSAYSSAFRQHKRKT